MPPSYRIYIEAGKHRVFAGGLDWPGWCRSGRTEEEARQTLLAYGPRYAAAVGSARRGFKAPTTISSLRVVERLPGDATTDFGAPSAVPSADRRSVNEGDSDRLTALLRACWKALDGAAETASGATLTKGPRGGGRELEAIVRHVSEADGAYLSKLGWKAPQGKEAGALREAILEAFRSRARDEPPPPSTRPKKLWTPRYALRRSAWHALDHAWEIQDRATLAGQP